MIWENEDVAKPTVGLGADVKAAPHCPTDADGHTITTNAPESSMHMVEYSVADGASTTGAIFDDGGAIAVYSTAAHSVYRNSRGFNLTR